MITRTIGGWALLINALLTLLFLIGMTASVGGDTLYLVTGEVFCPLLIAGLLAIWAMQPQSGRLGQIGLWCLGIATSIAFLVRLVILFSSLDVDTPAFISALFGMVGSFLVGWVTIRAKVFHPAIGWLLMVGEYRMWRDSELVEREMQHGKADLRGDHLARWLRRGRGWHLRLGGAG
jgi:hypothetical protein